MSDEVKGRLLGEEIMKDALRKSDRITEKAKAEKAKKTEAAQAEAEAAARVLVETAEARANADRARILAGAALEIKRKRLELITRRLESVCADALKRLCSMEWNTLCDWLEGEVRKGLALLGSDAECLELSQKLSPEERERFKVKTGFAGEVKGHASLEKGEAILRSAGGKLRYEVRFDEIFKSRQGALFAAALPVLFGGEA